MRRVSWLLIVFITLPSFAQSGSAPSPPVQITGVIESFSGNILDVKPATAPAVWVTIPIDLPVDRSTLKPGAAVSVEARWAVVCYLATHVTIQK